MRPNQRLAQNPFILATAQMMQATEANMKYAGLPRGTLRGTIVDVDDPEERGRVRVIFDDMNPDIPQALGTDLDNERVGGEPDFSHWIDVSPAFKGKQPKGMIGKRVNISASNGQYQFALMGDQIYDPQNLAKNKQKKLDMPDNSSMTRLPVYSSGELPPATAENVGCVVIEDGGFDGMQWLSVCLARSGGYAWVNLIDRLHIHDSQANDSAGDSEGTVNDDTHATT
jgi:hypothetical protein